MGTSNCNNNNIKNSDEKVEEVLNKKNFNNEQSKTTNIKIENKIVNQNKAKIIKAEEYIIKKKESDISTCTNKAKSTNFDNESKNKNSDNNMEFNDIEVNLNIKNCKQYLNKSEDEDCLFDDDEDLDDFEKNKIKKGKDELKESYISLDLMNKEEDAKFNLYIIWIDEKINSEENKLYLKKMKNVHPNISINVYDNLEEGFSEILKLEFVSIFVIVSGRLYSRYYNKLKENLVKIKCIPINLIFTSSKFKKILENIEPDTERIA